MWYLVSIFYISVCPVGQLAQEPMLSILKAPDCLFLFSHSLPLSQESLALTFHTTCNRGAPMFCTRGLVPL